MIALWRRTVISILVVGLCALFVGSGGAYGGVYGTKSGIIDSQDDVGGWPPLESKQPPDDSSGDGLPDWWVIRHGLDPSDSNEGNRDRNGDGYTNLQEYLNWLANLRGRHLDKHTQYSLTDP